MKDHDKDLLYQMLSYCTKIGERIEAYSIDEDEFVGNTALQDMLLMPIFQIGELANALSDEFCSAPAINIFSSSEPYVSKSMDLV